MGFKIESTHLNGIFVIVPYVYEDDRGFFMEAYREDKFKELGIPDKFVQDNLSGSLRGIVRGLHFQWGPPMGKLMRVTYGKAFLVSVDIRKGSPTLGQWFGFTIADGDNKQVWAPAGFARGIYSLSDYVVVEYKCTALHNKECESGILWNDLEIGIKWPLGIPILSEKDKNAKTLKEWLQTPESDNFRY